MPKNPGEYSLFRQMYRPPYGKRDEWFMMTPLGNTGALIPEHHTWVEHEDESISVSPSIVYFEYHGFLQKGVWS